MVSCGKGVLPNGIWAPTVCLPSSFWISKLESALPGTTRVKLGSWELTTLTRLEWLNPASNRKFAAGDPPLWHPDRAQEGVNTVL